jgi:hypothetical protein
MKFVVQLKNSTSGARLGAVSELKSHPDLVVQTPSFFVSTQGGLVPHLTFETLKLIPRIVGEAAAAARPGANCASAILQYPLVGIEAKCDAVKACGGGVADYVGMAVKEEKKN